MEKQEVRDINRVCTRFRGGTIAMDSYAVQVVLHHLPEGLLRCSVSAMDQELCWNCEHTGKLSLNQYCSKVSLGHSELAWIYGSLLKTLNEMKEFLLDVNCLILKPEHIYLEPQEEKEWLCYVPFYVKNVWIGLQELSQFFLGHVEKNDTEAVRIAYGLYQYFNQGGRDIEKAWAILCETAYEEKMAVEQNEDPDETKILGDLPEVEGAAVLQEESFPFLGWFIMGLSGTSAVFLLTYVALNEWYLTNKTKIELLVLIVLFTFVAVFIWKKWGYRMKKKNPLDQNEKDN